MYRKYPFLRAIVWLLIALGLASLLSSLFLAFVPVQKLIHPALLVIIGITSFVCFVTASQLLLLVLNIAKDVSFMSYASDKPGYKEHVKLDSTHWK